MGKALPPAAREGRRVLKAASEGEKMATAPEARAAQCRFGSKARRLAAVTGSMRPAALGRQRRRTRVEPRG